MKEIQLTKGYVAIVDDEDFERLSQHKWYASTQRKTVYARASIKNPITGERRSFLMHRLILGVSDPAIQVDHRVGNGLDNRRENLRTATHAENQRNRDAPKNNSTGYKGVCKIKNRKTWTAHIKAGDKLKYLGGFKCPKEAAKAYNKAAIELHGEFARLNQV